MASHIALYSSFTRRTLVNFVTMEKNQRRAGERDLLDPAGTRRLGEQRVLELYRKLFAGTVEITPEMRPRWKVPPGQLRHRLVPGVRFEWHKPLWHPTTVDLPEPQYDDMVAVYVHEWLAENIPRHRDKAPGTIVRGGVEEPLIVSLLPGVTPHMLAAHLSCGQRT